MCWSISRLAVRMFSFDLSSSTLIKGWQKYNVIVEQNNPLAIFHFVSGQSSPSLTSPSAIYKVLYVIAVNTIYFFGCESTTTPAPPCFQFHYSVAHLYRQTGRPATRTSCLQNLFFIRQLRLHCTFFFSDYTLGNVVRHDFVVRKRQVRRSSARRHRPQVGYIAKQF